MLSDASLPHRLALLYSMYAMLRYAETLIVMLNEVKHLFASIVITMGMSL